jgi:hypothetical protein
MDRKLAITTNKFNAEEIYVEKRKIVSSNIIWQIVMEPIIIIIIIN